MRKYAVHGTQYAADGTHCAAARHWLRRAFCVLCTAYCVLAPTSCRLAAAQCDSGACRPAGPHPAVVRVVNAAAGCLYHGSGTLVDKDERTGLVLTCAHLFRPGAGEVTVSFAEGQRYGARLVAVDPAWDLAALEIATPAAAPVALALHAPGPGDLLQSCGFGRDGRYSCNRGRALGYVRLAAAATHETLELSGSAREGDSGGPVFNERGELAAVVWGTDGRTVEATYCGRIRKFLAERLPRRSGPMPPDRAGSGAGPLVPIEPRGPSGQPAPALGDRLEELRSRLESQERSLGEKIDHVEKAVSAAAQLKERVEKAESLVGQENLRALVRDAATGIAAQGTPTLLAKILPGVLVALGWTGPPSIAAILALRLGAAVLRRRRRKRGQSPSSPSAPAQMPGRPINDDYAEQLARVYALSGRSPLADATLGRQYDQALREAETSSDGSLARWARALRERVARQFYRIHDLSPVPAEPVEEQRGQGLGVRG